MIYPRRAKVESHTTMEVLIRANAAEASRLGAAVIASLLRHRERPVLGLATGKTVVPIYEELIRLHRDEGLSFAGCTTFNLDEYVGLAAADPRSYHFFMRRQLFDHVDVPSEKIHLPDGTVADLRRACGDYEAAIRQAGGIDLQLLGIGANGHIGFNEPTGSLASRTWVKILSERTRRDNAPHFDDEEQVPRHVITMGIATILESRHCLLVAHGERKAVAVQRMIEGPVTAMCPASVLQMHPRVTIVVDEAAASRLTFRDHYRWVEANKLDWQRYD